MTLRSSDIQKRPEPPLSPSLNGISNEKPRNSERGKSDIKTLEDVGANNEITLWNKSNSSLLLLPGELRNMIYGFVLGGLDICPSRKWGCKPMAMTKILSIMFVCRRIHAEASLLVFELNTFELEHRLQCRSFLGALTDRQRDAVQNIAIHWTYSWEYPPPRR
ncbi:hypothetical protein PTT_06194 [Pyrenophora teres f. teres 0-1]|uniref:Uncharacterized protein n=1 Tax=Pyrenophora teres f. teres (strain 0-1) TaxID=861557 RepID=E3RFE7_PYRTT|nr:hypothetical protein PTT_06194 [Pyrenophora teres f. teres 0-1]